MTSLATDRRGATYVEFLVVVVPFVMFVLCVFQAALLEFADLVVGRAASAAARSAVVVLDDDPRQYGGEARNAVSNGGQRLEAIRRGAANALAALPSAAGAERSDKLTVTFPQAPGSQQVRTSFEPAGMVTVRVAYSFTCGVPMARRLMCRDGIDGPDGDSVLLVQGEASLPNQGARYAYSAGGGQ
jgi:hypothetical protein